MTRKNNNFDQKYTIASQAFLIKKRLLRVKGTLNLLQEGILYWNSAG